MQLRVHTVLRATDQETPPLFHAGACYRTMGFELGRVNHHGLRLTVLGSQTDHQPREDAFLTPALPTAI